MKKLLCLGLLLLSACASLPPPAADNRIASDYQRPAAGALLLVLPPKTEAGDLQAGNEILKQQLAKQLLAAGYQVAQLEPSNYELVWSQEVAAVGGIYDKSTGKLQVQAYAQALSTLIRRVSSETKAAMVLMPGLVVRRAVLAGTSAQWDGQARTVPSVGLGWDTATYSGSTNAMSVELAAYTAQGEFASLTFGGASLLYRVNYAEHKNEPRPNLFADDKEVADAVTLTIAPLVGKKQ